MRKVFIVLVNIFSLLGFYACSGSSETVVAEYGKYSVTKDEFKEAFDKNLSGTNETALDTTTDMKNFLDLYVNYKMKLRDAEVRGFEDDPELQNEISDYMMTVGVPYVQEKFIIEPGLKYLYEKRKYERRVKHILIWAKKHTDEDARTIAQNLLDRIKGGEKFEVVASEESEDQFSSPDSGDIYWLTAGQIVAPLDNAIFAAKVGEVYPELVKTKFGYHIIKVAAEQPRKYMVKARHILAAFEKDGKRDTVDALEKIEMVQQKLKDGEDFAELAKEYSDDPGSAKKGGDLGYFQRRMMIQPFDEAAFSLEVGQVSEPIKTKYGYHLLEVQDIKDYPSFEEEKENLKKIYQKVYFEYDSDKYLDTLKQEYNFAMNDSVLEQLKAQAEELDFKTTYWDSDLEKELGDSTLYSFNSNKYSVNGVITDIKDSQGLSNAKMSAANIDKAVNKQISDELFVKKAIDLKNGNTEFAKLMEDYKKGLYIFKLQEEEVWNKLDNDSTKLYAFYEQTKDNYVMPNRASFSVIFQRDSASIYKDYEALQNGTEFDSLLAKNSKSSYLKERSGEQELTSVEESKAAAKAYELEAPGAISEPFKFNKGWCVVKLISKEPSRLKTFDEARSEVSSAWMETETKRLENVYLNKLKELYHPKMYYDKLSEINSEQAGE